MSLYGLSAADCSAAFDNFAVVTRLPLSLVPRRRAEEGLTGGREEEGARGLRDVRAALQRVLHVHGPEGAREQPLWAPLTPGSHPAHLLRPLSRAVNDNPALLRFSCGGPSCARSMGRRDSETRGSWTHCNLTQTNDSQIAHTHNAHDFQVQWTPQALPALRLGEQTGARVLGGRVEPASQVADPGSQGPHPKFPPGFRESPREERGGRRILARTPDLTCPSDSRSARAEVEVGQDVQGAPQEEVGPRIPHLLRFPPSAWSPYIPRTPALL